MTGYVKYTRMTMFDQFHSLVISLDWFCQQGGDVFYDNFVDLWRYISNCQTEQKGRQDPEEGEIFINEQLARQEPHLFSLVWEIEAEAVRKGN